MVKNNTGGNKSKKQGRKHATAGAAQNQTVRRAVEEGEMYAAVTKIYGGSNCQVMGIDGISRQCVIRNNFKMRAKRENTLIVGTWILVGIRDWEVRSNGTQKCDLLEVYSHCEKDKLKQIESCNFASMNSIGETSDGVLFSNTMHMDMVEEEEENSADSSDADMDIERVIVVPKNVSKNVPKNVPTNVPNKKEKQMSLRELMSTSNKKDGVDQNVDQNDWLNINSRDIKVEDI